MAALRRWSCLDSQGSTTYRKVWPDTCLGGQLTRRFAPRAPNVGTVTVRVVVARRVWWCSLSTCAQAQRACHSRGAEPVR